MVDCLHIYRGFWIILTTHTLSPLLWNPMADPEKTFLLDPGMSIPSHNKGNLHISWRMKHRLLKCGHA